MTSNIAYTLIDEQYPVAGKDNNSQGFRDNFNLIKTGLAIASAEITDLQAKTVLTEDLSNGEPVINNLNGSSLTNGFYDNLHGNSHIASVSGTANINVSEGSIHVYTLTGNTTFTFTNWPSGTHYGKVKVHFVSGSASNFTIALFSTGGGTMHFDNNFPVAPFTAPLTGKHQIIEAWSYNNGATVYVKYLGSF